MTSLGRVVAFPRGSIWLYKAGDSEVEPGVQSGDRHAIVISNDTGNITNQSVMVAFITSNVDKDKYSVNVPFINLRGEKNVVLCNQIKTVNKQKLVGFRGMAPSNLMNEIEGAIREAIFLSSSNINLTNLESTVQKIIDAKVNSIQNNQPVITQDTVNNIAEQLEKLFEDILIPMDREIKEKRRLELESAAPIASLLAKGHTGSNNIDDEIEVNTKEAKEAKEAKVGMTDIPSKKPYGFWTKERKKEFVFDKEHMESNDLAKKWNISNPKTAYQMYYSFKKVVNN